MSDPRFPDDLAREPAPLHSTVEGEQELDFEWVRRFRDAGIALNPKAHRRQRARDAFLAAVQDELEAQRSASRH